MSALWKQFSMIAGMQRDEDRGLVEDALILGAELALGRLAFKLDKHSNALYSLEEVEQELREPPMLVMDPPKEVLLP
jgi:hypothetical protein